MLIVFRLVLFGIVVFKIIIAITMGTLQSDHDNGSFDLLISVASPHPFASCLPSASIIASIYIYCCRYNSNCSAREANCSSSSIMAAS